MSGHSKWANIKTRKGAQDKKRSAVFTVLSKNILTAIRTGGGNTKLESNLALKTAIDKAKLSNMPKENIDRLITRFEERKANLIPIVLEGYGPFGVPIIIEAETDNKNRTLGEIKLIFRDHEATVGGEGSVSFMFERKGSVEFESIPADLELELIDAGAQEIEENAVYTGPMDLINFVKKTEDMGLKVVESGLVMKCKNPTILENEEQVGEVLDLIEELEENDDVINVFTGFDYVQKI